MANELAQSFSLASHAMDAVRRTNLARDVSQAELGLRSLALGQQQQQLGQNAIRLQQEQQKINMARADQSMDFFAKFAPLVGADMQKEMFGHVAQQYVQAGVLPEGSTIEFPDVEEAGLEIQSLANRGMPDRAFSRLDELKRSAFKADLPLVAEIEKSLNLSEKAGSQKNLISNRQNGLLFSESEWARHMQGNPDDRRRENGEVQIAKDEVVQAVDLRSRELNLLRKIPAPILNEAMTVKRLADAGVVVSDEKLQLAINTQEAGNLATLIAEQENNGHPVPQFLYDALDLKFAQIGVGEKVPRHDEATRQELRNAKTQERLTNARIANLEVEKSRVEAHIRVLEATVPQIEANISQMQKLGENAEARTKLFQQQLLTEQKRMRAVAPRLIQERDKLSAEGEELFAEMEALSKDRNADPVALDDLGMKIAANVNAVDDLNAQIEFAEAVGPDLFLKYEQLGARIEDMKARREKSEKDLDVLEAERTAALTSKTLQEIDIKNQEIKKRQSISRIVQQLDLSSPTFQQDAQEALKVHDPNGALGLTVKDVADASGVKVSGDGSGPKGTTVPITTPDGRPGTAFVEYGPEGLRIGSVPTPGKPGEQTLLMSEKAPLVQIGSPGERKSLVETKALIEESDRLIANFDKVGRHIVGPLDQFSANVKRIAGLVPEDRLQYEKDLNKLAGEYRHQIFGSALTKVEKESALGFIPDMNDQDKDHLAKLKAMNATAKRLRALQEESMGIRKANVASVSDEDRLRELTDLGATYEEALRIMVEEGR